MSGIPSVFSNTFSQSSGSQEFSSSYCVHWRFWRSYSCPKWWKIAHGVPNHFLRHVLIIVCLSKHHSVGFNVTIVPRDWNDKVENVLHVMAFNFWSNSLILIATLYVLASWLLVSIMGSIENLVVISWVALDLSLFKSVAVSWSLSSWWIIMHIALASTLVWGWVLNLDILEVSSIRYSTRSTQPSISVVSSSCSVPSSMLFAMDHLGCFLLPFLELKRLHSELLSVLSQVHSLSWLIQMHGSQAWYLGS